MSQKESAGWLLTGAGLMVALVGISGVLTETNTSPWGDPIEVGLAGFVVIAVGMIILIDSREGIFGVKTKREQALLITLILVVALLAGMTAFYQHSANELQQENERLERVHESRYAHVQEDNEQLENIRDNLRQNIQKQETKIREYERRLATVNRTNNELERDLKQTKEELKQCQDR
jgi:flagellar basal body-associated protein FliL